MKETCDPYIVLILQRLLFGQIFVNVFCCDRDIRYEDFCIGLLACHVGLDDINCCSTLSGSVLKDCLCHLAVFDCLKSFCCAVDTADHKLAFAGAQRDVRALESFHSAQCHLIVCCNDSIEGHAALAVSILLDPCLCCLHAFVLDIVSILVVKDGDVAAACSLKACLHTIAAHCCVVQSGSSCQVADICVFGKDLCEQVTLHSAGLGVRRTDECVIKAVCAGCAVAEQDDRYAGSVGFLNSGNDACCITGDNYKNVNALGDEGLGLVDLFLKKCVPAGKKQICRNQSL